MSADRELFTLSGVVHDTNVDGQVTVATWPDADFRDTDGNNLLLEETPEVAADGSWSVKVPDNSDYSAGAAGTPYYQVHERSEHYGIDRYTYVKMAGANKTTTTGAVNPPIGAPGGPVVLTSPDGSLFTIAVANDGTLSSAAYTVG